MTNLHSNLNLSLNSYTYFLQFHFGDWIKTEQLLPLGYLSLLLQQDSTFWHFWDSRRQLNSRRTFHFLQTYSCSVLIESHQPKMHLRMWWTNKTHSPTWTFQFCVRMSFETFGTAAKVLNLSWEPKQTLIPLVLQLALGIWIALPSSSC